jgi:hypothetical protein
MSGQNKKALIILAVIAVGFVASQEPSSSGGPTLNEPQANAEVTAPDITGSNSIQSCLKSAGMTSKTDPIEMGANNYVGVYDADERWLATLDRNDTAAEALALANIDNEMQASDAEDAEADGWDVGRPPKDKSIAVENYEIDFVGAEPDDDAGRAITNCVKAFA